MKKSDIARVLRLVEESEEDNLRFLRGMIKARSKNARARIEGGFHEVG